MTIEGRAKQRGEADLSDSTAAPSRCSRLTLAWHSAAVGMCCQLQVFFLAGAGAIRIAQLAAVWLFVAMILLPHQCPLLRRHTLVRFKASLLLAAITVAATAAATHWAWPQCAQAYCSWDSGKMQLRCC